MYMGEFPDAELDLRRKYPTQI